MHLLFFQYSIQVALYCSSCLNFILAQISVSCLKNIWKFYCFSRTFDIWYFIFYVSSLGANKEDLLSVTYCIISLLPIGLNSFILRLFQHVMLLYMNMCCLIIFHVNMLILFKRLLTKEWMQCKHKNGKMLLHLACGSNYNGTILILNLFFSFSCFIDHKLYKFLLLFVTIWILCESWMYKG
jgi:hypothetical protein